MEPAERKGCLGLFARGPAPAPGPPAKPPGTCEMDDTGVRRWLEGGTCEAVTWEALASVELVTTETGPFVPDVFWVLVGGDGTGCAIPDQAELAPQLLERLQKLPDFDNVKLIEAMSSTENARFTLWKKG